MICYCERNFGSTLHGPSTAQAWESLLVKTPFFIFIDSVSHYFGTLPRLLNYVFKRGSATANVLGVIAVMYSGFGVLLSYGRGVDDELNTLAAGTTTGLLYKCSCEQMNPERHRFP
jgi:hypothetical protein